MTMDTARSSGRGVPIFDSDSPRLSDVTVRFFRTFSSSKWDGEAADPGALFLRTGHVLLANFGILGVILQ